MDFNKKLEEMVKTVNEMIDVLAKEKSPEIQETVAKLSEVDVKLKHAIEELEKLDANDVETHNDLAEKLDKLLDEVVAEKETSEKEQKPEEPKEPKEEEEPKHIVIHVKGVVMRPMPIPFPFPFFW